MATPSNSRFKLTPLINIDGVESYGRWVEPAFINDPNLAVSKFTVTNSFQGRTDLISNQVYGTSELFWVIIAYNKPRDPLNWPKAGDIIDIPDIQVVLSEL